MDPQYLFHSLHFHYLGTQERPDREQRARATARAVLRRARATRRTAGRTGRRSPVLISRQPRGHTC